MESIRCRSQKAWLVADVKAYATGFDTGEGKTQVLLKQLLVVRVTESR